MKIFHGFFTTLQNFYWLVGVSKGNFNRTSVCNSVGDPERKEGTEFSNDAELFLIIVSPLFTRIYGPYN